MIEVKLRFLSLFLLNQDKIQRRLSSFSFRGFENDATGSETKIQQTKIAVTKI